MAQPVIPESQGVNRNSFATGVLNVVTAGSAQTLGPQEVPDGYAIVLRAKSTNTGIIYYGFSKSAAENPLIAAQLGASDFIGLYLTNTDLIWITSSVNGEGATWAVETAP